MGIFGDQLATKQLSRNQIIPKFVPTSFSNA